MLNASNARVNNLQFDDGRRFDLVGTDGGLLDAPVSLRQVQVSPGERVEIVVRLGAGETTVLRSEGPDMGLDFVQGRFSGGDDRFELLQLRAADDLTTSPAVPERLADLELPDPDDAVTTRSFELQGRSRINGEELDMDRIDTVVSVDTNEIWEVTNGSGNPTASTSTTCSSGSSTGAATHVNRPSAAGRTPSSSRQAAWCASPCGSPTTRTPPRRTCTTATSSRTRTPG